MQNIPLFKVRMNPTASELVGSVLNSGFIGQGKVVDDFESQLSKTLNHPFPITVNSATSGLILALRLAIGDDHGEVLTQPITCTATNWAILTSGSTITWVDTDVKTCNMDLDDLRRKLSPKTKAIMVVHWGGEPINLDKLKEIQDECYEKYGTRPPVIEDAAHAMCAEYNGKQLGSHGNYVVYSLQAIKHLTSGDGGILLCPDKVTSDRARLLRWYGLDRTQSESFRCGQNIAEYGYKFHMNDINAAIGIKNLELLQDTIEIHRRNNSLYNQKLQSIPGITLLEQNHHSKTSAWIYTIRATKRNALQAKLTNNNIASSKVHDRNDKHDCVAQYRNPSLTGTGIMDEEMLCLPVGWWVTESDIDYIVNVIKSGW